MSQVIGKSTGISQGNNFNVPTGEHSSECVM